MADSQICVAPRDPAYVDFGGGFGRRFLLTVDTEEEFDWNAPLDRQQHSVAAIPAIRTFLAFCEGFGVIPVFLVDYPIAIAPEAAEILAPAIQAGTAEVGVQLHPWVNPPFEEIVSEFNSFAGNLPAELEQAKFTILRDTIAQNFGAAPLVYRCGRYGAGPHTARILTDGGIAIDTSVRANFDYSSGGGPNYREHPTRPYWLNRAGGLLELPLTTVYSGALRKFGNWLHPRMWRVPRLRGVLARLRLLERVPLTPEGVSVSEAIRGIDAAIEADLPVLVFSFHSPSLVPGNTTYVRDSGELDALYDWWRHVFAYLASRDIQPASVAEIMRAAKLA